MNATKSVIVSGALVLALSGCSGLSDLEQRTLSGGAIGAGAGAVGTAITGGCVSCGAALGGAAGAAVGYITGKDARKR